jgi:hypothetical protein
VREHSNAGSSGGRGESDEEAPLPPPDTETAKSGGYFISKRLVWKNEEIVINMVKFEHCTQQLILLNKNLERFSSLS